MKKIQISLMMVLVLILQDITLNAQSWSTTGNQGTNPAVNFIGTSDHKDLRFRTNNQVVVTFKDSGNVGIGTTSPTSRLQIEGSGQQTILVRSLTNSASLALDRKSGDATVVFKDQAKNIWKAGMQTNSDFLIKNFDLVADALRISKSTNYISIGTLGGQLGPNATAMLDISRGTPTATNSTLVLRGSLYASYFNYGTGENTFIEGGKSGAHVWINSSSSGNVMIATAGGGKVGVGTTNPNERLSVKGINNISSTNIASFKSNDEIFGIGIGYSTIRTLGSLQGYDLILDATATDGYVSVANKKLKVGKYKVYDTDTAYYTTKMETSNDTLTIKVGQKESFKYHADGNSSALGETTWKDASGNRAIRVGGCCRPTGTGGYLTINTNGTGSATADIAGITSDSNVVKVTTVYSGAQDIVGVNAVSTPINGYGIGMAAFGGFKGIIATASNVNTSDPSYGGVFNASGTGNGVRYGAYASASGSSINNWAFFGNGSSFANGGTWQSSDSRLKKEVRPLENALTKILALHPSTYEFKTEEFAFMNLPKEKQYGFLAQDLAKEFPELVKDIQQPLPDKDGNPTRNYATFKGVNYDQLIAVLVSAVQEQHAETEAFKKAVTMELEDKDNIIEKQNQQLNLLNQRMDQFENALMQCCNSSITNAVEKEGEIKGDVSSLEQNAPNPFNENTSIKFYLPSSVREAIIKITSLEGVFLKSYTLNQRGAGNIMISGNTLQSGTYTYSLFVDGKLIDSKQMTLTR